MPALQKCQRGITLIELLIVISLLSIFAAAMIPSTTPAVSVQLSAAAQRVADDIAYCRSLAVANNSEYRLRFQSETNRYILEYSGHDSTLVALPFSIMRRESDPPHQQIIELHDLPGVVLPVDLVAVQEQTTPPRFVDTLKFGPLGELRMVDRDAQAEETIIWLGCGQAADRLYQAIRVNPVTGLTWVENIQSTKPATPTN